jgi:hypothetical protein
MLGDDVDVDDDVDPHAVMSMAAAMSAVGSTLGRTRLVAAIRRSPMIVSVHSRTTVSQTATPDPVRHDDRRVGLGREIDRRGGTTT